MDELLSLILVVGIGIVSSRLKAKKGQEKSARKSRGFDEAIESMAEGKKGVSREILAQFMPELMDEEKPMPVPPPKPTAPAQPKVKRAEPLVKAPAESAAKAAPVAKSTSPAKPAGPILKRMQAAPFVQVSKPQPVLFMDHDEPEGTISTQGESPEEHAGHMRRIFAEEDAIRMEHEALQEVRNMNLQKLRSAVVMSEILDKPVSLRRRRTF